MDACCPNAFFLSFSNLSYPKFFTSNKLGFSSLLRNFFWFHLFIFYAIAKNPFFFNNIPPSPSHPVSAMSRLILSLLRINSLCIFNPQKKPQGFTLYIFSPSFLIQYLYIRISIIIINEIYLNYHTLLIQKLVFVSNIFRSESDLSKPRNHIKNSLLLFTSYAAFVSVTSPSSIQWIRVTIVLQCAKRK